MSNMIGKKSGVDWSKAPESAQYYCIKTKNWYKYYDNDWYYALGLDSSERAWGISSNLRYKNLNEGLRSSENNLISKEGDLKVSKTVSSIEDLEIGMFLKIRSYTYVIIAHYGTNFTVAIVDRSNTEYPMQTLDIFESWSYTYNGEYTPIVKEPVETEAQKKAKELQKVLDDAQKSITEAQIKLNDLKGEL